MITGLTVLAFVAGATACSFPDDTCKSNVAVKLIDGKPGLYFALYRIKPGTKANVFIKLNWKEGGENRQYITTAKPAWGYYIGQSLLVEKNSVNITGSTVDVTLTIPRGLLKGDYVLNYQCDIPIAADEIKCCTLVGGANQEANLWQEGVGLDYFRESDRTAVDWANQVRTNFTINSACPAVKAGFRVAKQPYCPDDGCRITLETAYENCLISQLGGEPLFPDFSNCFDYAVIKRNECCEDLAERRG